MVTEQGNFTIGFIPANRGFFSSELAAKMRGETIAAMQQLGTDVLAPGEDQTEVGCVQSLQEAEICAELFRWHYVEGIVVAAINFGAGQSVAWTVRKDALNVPVHQANIANTEITVSSDYSSLVDCTEFPRNVKICAVGGGEPQDAHPRASAPTQPSSPRPALPDHLNGILEQREEIPMSDNSGPPKVYICYVEMDAERAREICHYLKLAGADPWFDKEKLVLGDRWEQKIEKAVNEADVFVVLLRPEFNETGHRQKEVQLALEAWKRRPPDRGFIIPFVTVPCELPPWCKPIHAGSNLIEESKIDDLLVAIEEHCNVKLRKP